MSLNLYAGPAYCKAKSFPTDLKWKLEKALDLYRGLVDCGMKDAAALIEYIEKHDEVEVFLGE